MTGRKKQVVPPRHRRSRGVALIMAILITSLVSIAAVAMITQQQLEIRRTQNILHFDQAYAYVLGAETWAKSALVVQDKEPESDAYPSKNNVNDIIGKPIAEEVKQSGLDIGGINGIITDASASFPLNMLVNDQGEKNEAYWTVFEALVANNLDNAEFQNLENLALDWIDKDDTVSTGGAEDNDYLNLAAPNRPYRAANRPISSITELRLMLAMSKDPGNIKNDYAALARPSFNPLNAVSLDDIEKQSLINALPREASTNITININTAPSPVLKALVDYVDPNLANGDKIVKDLVEKRKEEAQTNVKDMFIQPITDEVEKTKPPNMRAGQAKTPAIISYERKKQRIEELEQMVAVKSEYFYLTAHSKIGDTDVMLISLLHRKDGKVTTVRRGIGVI